jgi:hypothetical protein
MKRKPNAIWKTFVEPIDVFLGKDKLIWVPKVKYKENPLYNI